MREREPAGSTQPLGGPPNEHDGVPGGDLHHPGPATRAGLLRRQALSLISFTNSPQRGRSADTSTSL